MPIFRHSSSKPDMRTANRFRPQVESLEHRRLLAADPGFELEMNAVRAEVRSERFTEESRVGPANNAAQQALRNVSVMSWNLYLGGDLDPVFNALLGGDPQQIVETTTGLWHSVLATNFEIRAEAIADQIEMAEPTLIGLQEAVVWRTGPVSPQPAENVQFDFTKILLDELQERASPMASLPI